MLLLMMVGFHTLNKVFRLGPAGRGIHVLWMGICRAVVSWHRQMSDRKCVALWTRRRLSTAWTLMILVPGRGLVWLQSWAQDVKKAGVQLVQTDNLRLGFVELFLKRDSVVLCVTKVPRMR